MTHLPRECVNKKRGKRNEKINDDYYCNGNGSYSN